MGKSILSLVAEAQRQKNLGKNINGGDDVTKAGYEDELNSLNRFAGEVTQSDVNVEGENILDISKRRLEDIKDFNVFPQDSYELTDVYLNDASVIDMPEIEEVSPVFYYNLLKYNNYVNYDYTVALVGEPTAPIRQTDNYLTYIEDVIPRDFVQGTEILDIMVGVIPKDETPLGKIGKKALATYIGARAGENIGDKISGIFNKSQKTMKITKDVYKKGGLLQTIKNGVQKFLNVEPKFSPIKSGWVTHRIYNEKEGKWSSVGSLQSRTEAIFDKTPKSLKKHIGKNLNQNIYTPYIDKYLESNYYYEHEVLGEVLNFKDFDLPKMSVFIDAHGSISRNGNNSSKSKFSDRFQFTFIDDYLPTKVLYGVNSTQAGVKYDLNYKLSQIGDDIKTHSLLYKTIRLVHEKTNDSFVDQLDKNFLETHNGDTLRISRGDTTTASGQYIDDDGATIEKDEFFRVWTKDRQYSRLSRALRHRGLDNGDKRSVLNDNGLVNFAPTERQGRNGDDIIKRYMFSLENLAWNDNMNDLPECEQGVGDPVTGTRGRIMWFPPYNLNITENVTSDMLPHIFIGRSEPVFTYNTTSRTASLNFTIIVDHPDIVNKVTDIEGEYWERYFKGDKLVMRDAINKLKNSKKLTPNQINQLDKNRKIITPIPKVVDVPVTPPDLTEDPVKETDGYLLSVHFPNDDTNLPILPYVKNYIGLNVGSVNTKSLTLHNAGYEMDFLYSDDFKVGDNNDFTVKNSSGGLAIKQNGKLFNQVKGKKYTYRDGSIKNRGAVCGARRGSSELPEGYSSAPVGYRETKSFAFNKKWYEVFQHSVIGIGDNEINNNSFIKEKYGNIEILPENLIPVSTFNNLELIKLISKDVAKYYKKVKVKFIGNASGASPIRKSNTTLSTERAKNTKAFFEKVTVPFLREKGVTTEFVYETTSYKGDSEDEIKKTILGKILKIYDPNLDISSWSPRKIEKEFEKIPNRFNYFFSSIDIVLEELEKEDIDKYNQILVFYENFIQGLDEFCVECDESDERGCKMTRRVDIYIEVLDDTIEEPKTEVIEEPEDDEQVDIDDDQNPPEEEDVVLSPDIISKLLYTECDFFKYLEINEPVAYQTIKERIKYFSRSYHSITPQGFNSRLTFLQQCMRQSDSLKEDGVNNFKNLAFGRMPVCILRIGDFYHTRVLISSMNINYPEGITWDLNPEGIGVQPMYADISLELKIIGGSSMTAPINRLQNALSFNYYANTEMYDARADSVVFKRKEGTETTSSDEETFGTLKNGEIIDGIRLSNFQKVSSATAKKNLARQRRESRVVLNNGFTPFGQESGTTESLDNVLTSDLATQEEFETFGQSYRLLEMKKRANVALTEVEKVKYATIKAVNDAANSKNIPQSIKKQTADMISKNIEKDFDLSSGQGVNDISYIVNDMNNEQKEALKTLSTNLAEVNNLPTDEKSIADLQEFVYESVLNSKNKVQRK